MSSPLLTVSSLPRQVVYQALLSEPGRVWTVRTMHEAVTAGSTGVHVEAVRTVLYLLLADTLLEEVPGARSLTMRLTGDGTVFVAAMLDRWKRDGPAGGSK